MRYERDAITMLVYARNSINTWHRLKFLRLLFTTYKFYENATSCISRNFQSVFAHFISSCYQLHNKVWSAKIELFLRYLYQCVRKENDFLSTPPPFSLALSLSLFAFNQLLCNIWWIVIFWSIYFLFFTILNLL